MAGDLTALLLERLKKPEDGLVEFKASYKTSEFREAAVAFSNSLPSGEFGVIYLGVNPDGSIKGFPKDGVEKQQHSIRNDLNYCYPQISPTIYILHPEPEKPIIAVVVSAGLNKPYFVGRSFIRVGSSTVEASDQQFSLLVAERNSKVAAIRKMKGTLISLYRRFGNFNVLAPQDVYVQEVLDHHVRFKMANSDTLLSYPTEALAIGFNEGKGQPAIYLMV